MERDQQCHLLVFPYPGQGHINPLMQFSLRLAASSTGILITFLTTHGNHINITESWSKQGLMPPSQNNLRMASIPDHFLPPRSMHGIVEFFRGLKKLRQPLEEFILNTINDSSCGPPVTCIIFDSLLTWVSDLANELGICWVPYFPSPVSLFLVLHHAVEGLIPERVDQDDDPLIDLPGLVPFQYSELPTLVVTPEGTRQHISVDITRDARNAPWILINTCEALEHEALEVAREAGFNFIPVAPLLPKSFLEKENSISGNELRTSSLWQQDDTCLEWLDKQSPSSVLYVSFGSIAGMEFEDLETIQRGIIKSGVKFLWVLRPDLVSGITEEKYKVFVENSKFKDQGLVVRWSPQLQVLLHPAVRAFLTHCGWNSTFESICAELPMICWPCFAEQKLNCKYIVDVWKIGLKLCKEHEPVTEADIERVVLEMMEGKAGKLMKARAVELSKACKDEFHKKDGTQWFAALVLK